MIKRLIISMMSLLICVVALGDETNWTFSKDYVDVDGLRYHLDIGNKVAQVLLGNYGMEENVIVPEAIKYDNTNYTVRSVNNYSNSGYGKKVKTITLPVTIKEIKNNAFSYVDNLKKLTLKTSVPPTLEGNLRSNLKIYIPAGTIHSYRIANERWNSNNVLIDGDGISVFVTITTSGTLADEVIKKVDYLQEVNKLSIAGAINYADLSTVKDYMPNLVEIDLSEADCEALPSYWLSSRFAMEKITLPVNIKSIGGWCFSACKSIETMTLPEGLTSAGSNVFSSCTSLREVTLPSTLRETGQNMFLNCTSLKIVNFSEGLTTIQSSTFESTAIQEIRMPSTMKNIEVNAFGNCKYLSKVILNEGLTKIMSGAFYNCTSLEEVELPASLEWCDDIPFSSCKNLKNITMKAISPAYIGGKCPIGSVDLSQVTLYVPSVSLSAYKSTPGWSDFYTINSIASYKPQVYDTCFPFSLTVDTDDREEGYTPDMMLQRAEINSDYYYGAITISGSGALALKKYTGYYDYRRAYNNSESVCMTSLVNNIAMTAEEATTILRTPCERWIFVSFPYDVNIKDIKVITEGTVDFVIRKYSGENRALGDLNYTWIDVPADGKMKAYEGYIMNVRAIDSNGRDIDFCEFEMPAFKPSGLSNLLTNEKAVVVLNEYASEFAHNRSWNLVGNPYPCYYDTRNMNISAPITVWNIYSRKYEAYSPVDDNYVLMPGEAFFVQRPEDLSAITFDLDGRQITRKVKDSEQARAAVRGAVREVMNFYLSDADGNKDRTRVVLNANASACYEIDKDAAKFITTDVCQIYSVGGNANYAINERPVSADNIQLMTYCPKAGKYAITMDGNHNTKVVLADSETGKSIELTDGAIYQFDGTKGASARFSLIFGDDDTTGVDTVVKQNGDNTIYTISGTKVEDAKDNGIYIINGKKVVVKK